MFACILLFVYFIHPNQTNTILNQKFKKFCCVNRTTMTRRKFCLWQCGWHVSPIHSISQFSIAFILFSSGFFFVSTLVHYIANSTRQNIYTLHMPCILSDREINGDELSHTFAYDHMWYFASTYGRPSVSLYHNRRPFYDTIHAILWFSEKIMLFIFITNAHMVYIYMQLAHFDLCVFF